MYVYIKTGSLSKRDPNVWTVGFFDPAGEFRTDSDHSSRVGAAMRVRWLNGGDVPKDWAERFERGRGC